MKLFILWHNNNISAIYCYLVLNIETKDIFKHNFNYLSHHSVNKLNVGICSKLHVKLSIFCRRE